MERACVSFATLSISEYARRLASADPTPGGGSASAVAGALGASLVSMVARLTAASPAFATHADRMRIVAERGERLSSAFLASSDEDVAAFDKVSASYKLAKSTDAERTARTSAIQTALIGASDVPMHVVELALETVRLAVELVDVGNQNAISDAGCAALFAQTAARGAALNIRINIKSIKDETRAASYESRLSDMLAQIGILTEVGVVKVERAVLRS